MIVAALVLVAGFLAVSYVTQTRGLRMGGTIVVPVLALYTLKNFVALPVFLVSFGLAYVALWAAKRYTLVYGRTEVVVSIVAGSMLPLALLFLSGFTDAADVFDLHSALFVGSVLPGLAAYNVQQLKPEYRRQDIGYAAGIYVGLLAVGAALVDPRLASTLATHTPLVLFAKTSDVAVVRGAVVSGTLYPVLLSRTLAVALLVVAFLGSEWGRSRFGVRAGVVSMGLLAIYATASKWLVFAFLLELVAVIFVVGVVHWMTLWYGRVLVGVGSATAVALSVPLAMTLPIVRGLSAVFIAVLVGTTAYNDHVTAPRERRMRIPLMMLVFSPMFLAARVLGEPYGTGLLADLPTVPALLALTVVAMSACYLLLRHYGIEQPSDETVFSASVLSGGDR